MTAAPSFTISAVISPGTPEATEMEAKNIENNFSFLCFIKEKKTKIQSSAKVFH